MGADRFYERMWSTGEPCTRVHAEDAATLGAIERSRVVAALDAWAAGNSERFWDSGMTVRGDFHCALFVGESMTHCFHAPTPDQARADAAKSIEAEGNQP